MNRLPKRRALPLLLFFALLIVSVAILIPTAASADPEPKAEMDDLSCQVLNDLDLANPEDGKTVLRCLFTIGSLDYEEVGFVFSKTNATVEKSDSPKSNYVSATTVYNSIIAGGDPVPAGENRWWVAVKLQNIPHEYFDGPIYVRAFVTDTDANGGETRYSGAYCITVCAAAGHTHTIVEDYDTLGTATMKTPGTLIGHCNGCNLDNVTEYNVANRNAFIYDMKALNGTSVSAPAWGDDKTTDKSFLISKSIGEIRGANHFYPDSTSIGAQGNDLWFEYSFLMNETFWNYDSIFGKGEMKAFSFRLDDPSKTTEKDVKTDFYYLYGSDGATGDCPYKGHFDYSTYKSMSEGHGAECAEDLTSENIYYRGNQVGRFGAGWTVKDDERAASPYLYDSETASEQMYGWHRLGFRYHQEVESVSNTGDVTYSAYTELYLDGIKVWKVHSNAETIKNQGLLLWTAVTGGDSTIDSYTDNDNMLVEMYLGNAALED
ncbi:MAG: hypothetical protein IKP74_04250, partial [Clostridia bacterium]|nr:hypothetical protein [Clostridia bacterium]